MDPTTGIAYVTDPTPLQWRMDVRKTVLVGHSAGEMFDVIEAAEHYPEFLPWCAAATIVARSDAEVVADINVNFHGVRFAFRTRNPKRRPEWMAIELERGPFRDFRGTWNLAPLSAAGCRVDFELHYAFDSTPMARLARPVFDRITNTLVDRFVARADAVYPPQAPPPDAEAVRVQGLSPHDQGVSAAPTGHAVSADRETEPLPTPHHPDHRSEPS
jgi:ribosome-associated toxin RatA of RatAB toxin-antitoxin module